MLKLSHADGAPVSDLVAWRPRRGEAAGLCLWRADHGGEGGRGSVAAGDRRFWRGGVCSCPRPLLRRMVPLTDETAGPRGCSPRLRGWSRTTPCPCA